MTTGRHSSWHGEPVLMGWWVYRGWAFTAAVLLGVPAVALQPPYPVESSGLPSQAAFGAAALLYLCVGVQPERRHMRALAAVFGTFATSLRALTLLLDDSPWKFRLVGMAAWTLAMLFCASAPYFTERYTQTGAARRCMRSF